MNITDALKNWIPYKVFIQENQQLCRWLLIDDKSFTEPFFDETISRYRQHPYNSLPVKCASSIDILPEWSEDIDSIQPTAFIFHVSRCGSTLVSQLLSLPEENIVLSEVPFFDELLRMKNRVAEMNSSELLKAAISFYAAKRNSKQCRLFIKTDSWHLLFYQQIRELYPNTPFILLYRHPAEVMGSQQKRRGMQSIPGIIEPELFGFDKEIVREMLLDDYMAKVLERYFQLMLTIMKDDPLAIPVNYDEGALAIVKKIARVTQMPLDEKYITVMKERAGYHGKYPGEIFGKEKLPAAMPVNCAKAAALYESLEKLKSTVAVQPENELI